MSTAVRKITLRGSGTHDISEVQTSRRTYQTEPSRIDDRISYTISYPVINGADGTPDQQELSFQEEDFQPACTGGSLPCPCGVVI
jgi:hypothetical protein